MKEPEPEPEPEPEDQGDNEDLRNKVQKLEEEMQQVNQYRVSLSSPSSFSPLCPMGWGGGGIGRPLLPQSTSAGLSLLFWLRTNSC